MLLKTRKELQDALDKQNPGPKPGTCPPPTEHRFNASAREQAHRMMPPKSDVLAELHAEQEQRERRTQRSPMQRVSGPVLGVATPPSHRHTHDHHASPVASFGLLDAVVGAAVVDAVLDAGAGGYTCPEPSYEPPSSYSAPSYESPSCDSSSSYDSSSGGCCDSGSSGSCSE